MTPSFVPLEPIGYWTLSAVKAVIEDLREQVNQYQTENLRRETATDLYHFRQLEAHLEADEILAII